MRTFNYIKGLVRVLLELNLEKMALYEQHILRWGGTYSFPWAKKDVSNELGRSGGNGPADDLVLGGVLTSSRGIDILEDLIETELSEALGTVSNEGWGPADGETLEALSGGNLLKSITDGFVHAWVSLKGS